MKVHSDAECAEAGRLLGESSWLADGHPTNSPARISREFRRIALVVAGLLLCA